VRSSLVAATRIRAHLRDDLSAFLSGGGRLIGICNGCQVLTRPWQHPDYVRRKKEIEAREPGGLAIFRAGVTGF